VDTLKDTLRIFAEMAGGSRCSGSHGKGRAQRLRHGDGLADYLVKKGVRFATPTNVAHAVKAAIASGVDLTGLPLAALQQFKSGHRQDVYGVMSLRGSLNAATCWAARRRRRCARKFARHRARLA